MEKEKKTQEQQRKALIEKLDSRKKEQLKTNQLIKK